MFSRTHAILLVPPFGCIPFTNRLHFLSLSLSLPLSRSLCLSFSLLCFAVGLGGWADPIPRSVERPHPVILKGWAWLYSRRTRGEARTRLMNECGMPKMERRQRLERHQFFVNQLYKNQAVWREYIKRETTQAEKICSLFFSQTSFANVPTRSLCSSLPRVDPVFPPNPNQRNPL